MVHGERFVFDVILTFRVCILRVFPDMLEGLVDRHSYPAGSITHSRNDHVINTSIDAITLKISCKTPRFVLFNSSFGKNCEL